MDQPRVITIEELRREIREYGCGKLARLIGYSRQYVARIASGKRNPSARFLAKLSYQPITLYRDIMPPTTKQ
jgi:transcriptional regulator with XRE-family HTH domain